MLKIASCVDFGNKLGKKTTTKIVRLKNEEIWFKTKKKKKSEKGTINSIKISPGYIKTGNNSHLVSFQ